MNKMDTELLLCWATGKPIPSSQKLFGATRGDSNLFFPISEEAIKMIPRSAMDSSPGNPDFLIQIHEGFSSDDGKGNFLAEDFHLGKFQFAIPRGIAEKYLNLHLKSNQNKANSHGNEEYRIV